VGGGDVARRACAARASEGQDSGHALRELLTLEPRLLPHFHVPVLQVLPKCSVGGEARVLGVGSAARRWW